ncbi:MAG: glutamate synthase-related protein [Gammaproteobacteria bacterium]
MSQPIIADNKPVKTTLEKDKEYYYCTCGRSKTQPFCDGSHAGTGFTPLAFTPEESGDAYLCQCKHTANSPYCDGTHKQFSDNQIGQEVEPIVKSSGGSATATVEEPTVTYIHELARNGLSNTGKHGPMDAMGVPVPQLPRWDDIQIMVAQMAKKPLMEDQSVGSQLVIGPEAKKPLELAIPLYVSDMSFGALSEEAKIALAKGAEIAGTGISSGEGGMLPEEQEANSRYFYELASARFGYSDALLEKVQAFHFKGGQAAKTGTGGHLPGIKNQGKISQVRGIPQGEPAISPPAFDDMTTPKDFARFAEKVRDLSGGIPIGFKLSANKIEHDVEFALEAGADYIVIDGRGGGTGAAPLLFRDHISVPTIPALARARHCLDKHNASGRVTLIVTGGLRVPSDFIKALALGADGIGLSTSAMQAIGCVAARMCHTNQCPSGVATQDKLLRKRLNIDQSAQQLANFLLASTELMKVMARACGHDHLKHFNPENLATWKRDMADLSGVEFAGYDATR